MGVVSLKHQPKGAGSNGTTDSDVKGFLSTLTTRRTKLFTYGFIIAFVLCTAYIAFCPAGGESPWFNDLFISTAPYRSQFSSFISAFFFPPSNASPSYSAGDGGLGRNTTELGFGSGGDGRVFANHTNLGVGSQPEGGGGADGGVVPARNHTGVGVLSQQNGTLLNNHSTQIFMENKSMAGEGKSPTPFATTNITNNSPPPPPPPPQQQANPVKSNSPPTKNWSVEIMKDCNIFYGNWVKDDSYPLYPEGSCGQIDESFNCVLNGRPDQSYQKLRWQPNGCNIPRLNPRDMLERLRKKRLVFVGDSLNRNMWESLVCILKNSVKDKKKVYEITGHQEFRSRASYSFYFKDYDCTVEFFQSHFLVQEWEMPDTNGSKTETLRLDIISRSASKYKDADIIIFNTGHWWTHDKTSKGKDYYQEGNRVYNALSVVDAYRKALNTWAKWVDYNINPKKSLVFFRGFSANHFKGGRWNSGGQCDSETEPIENDNYLSPYPWKMKVLESVLGEMKTRVSYLNITRMTDYRKDAHPSVYRKSKASKDKSELGLKYQDCSHWCLPGVPDSWNELLYAQILIKQHPI